MKQKALSIVLVFGLPLFVALIMSWSVSGARAERPVNSPVSDLEVDLAVQLTSQPRPAVVGGVITYTAVVRSFSEVTPITTITVTLEMDPAVVVSDFFFSDGDFSSDSGLWSGLNLTATAPITLTITGHINESLAPGVTAITSTISITTSQAFDPNLENNISTDSNPLVFVNDLGLQLSSRPRPAIAGAPITYTAVVTSSNPAQIVTMVSLSLDIDTTVTDLDYHASEGDFDPNTGDWTNISLTPMSAITLTITGLVDPGASGNLSSSAQVTSTQVIDPIPANNLANDDNPVIQIADLSVDKSAQPAAVVAGQLLTYTLTAVNNGPSAAANVALTDTLPAQVEFVSVDNASCQPILDQTVLVCSWATLDAATTVEITLLVQVDPLAADSLTNMAEISSDTEDPNLDNNDVTLETPVTAVAADLSVSKTANAGSVIAGETLTYTITITNAGPAAASQIVLTDTLPAAVTEVTAPPNCVANNGVLICSVSDLAAGLATDFDLVVAVAPDARNSLTNAVAVSSAEIDPHPSNNSDTAVTAVTAEANLSLGKTVQPATVAGHAPFTYTLVVANSGPSAALNTTLTDNWPPGLTLVSAPSNCSLVGAIMNCDLGIMPPDSEPVTLDIVARATTVSPTDNLVFANSAVVTSDAGSSNTASVNVTVTPYGLFLPTIVKPKEWQQVGTVPTGVTAFYDIVTCTDQMFVGANNGIYRWQANNWQRQTSGPDGIVLQLAFANDLCDRIYAASFGGGIWLGTRSGSSWNWNQVNANLSSARAVVVRGDTLFAAGDFGLYSASVANHNFTPTTITTAVNGLTIDQDGVTIFATVWNNGVFTNSGGALWTKQGTVTNPLVWRAVGDGQGNPLLVGTETGLNLWQNGNWTAVAPGYNSRTRAVATTDNALYAAQLGRGVIASYDNGQSWQPLNAGLPVNPTAEYYSLRTFDDGYLYVATIFMIYRWPLP